MINKTASLNKALSDICVSRVTLLDEYEKNAFQKEKDYLSRLDEKRLLRGFCDIAGIESDAEKYGGWESSAIQGHTLGHYLTAVSQAYASSGDEFFRKRAESIVDTLQLCQNKESGYLAAIPEEHYIQLERGDTTGTWVPWYNMHKLLSGLVSAFEFTKNPLALTVASALGDWVYKRTSFWDEETQKRVLNIEYGGMNDCLYRLYSHTKSQKHLQAAHSFDEMSLFDALHKGEDILDGKHANTTIPKILGALRRYIVLGQGEEYYLETAKSFWDIVTGHHTYITGGNSEWEHFGKADILDAERTECNCETCNTYNMLKLTRELFKITGDVKYADYYENAFINAILSSQNPESGMTTYFQPMATGFFKVYSSETDHFWCCTGSGMESFTKLSDSIYFEAEDAVYVTRYTSSSVKMKNSDAEIIQSEELPLVHFRIKGKIKTDIMLRVPDWCKGKPQLEINGTRVSYEQEGGFIRVSQRLSDGDEICVNFPLKTEAVGLKDNKNAVAFRYGSWVLSARFGKDDMKTSTTGVNVTVPVCEKKINDRLTFGEKLSKEEVAERIIKKDNESFILKTADGELEFIRHYKQYTERYGIYFYLD